MIKMDAEVIELGRQMESAKQSKQSFINFIIYLEIPQVDPWVIGWLEEYWTDQMSRVFFERFYNGSLDSTTLYLETGEILPSLLDDIEECIRSFSN
ncbi:hypothetical protein [Paenibacillus naphthalenovorans]|uniref:Uncharacterized protein n=1 Tax=Paenibacillus naphthalenovorans TaxID=162209 RepID=A0A0U2U7D6_9BACL|nr:hypothetical protein [Paenibacillus naphthalenovorans]ALS22088.1 hypothetical protein IJ22_17140 [Paenibacillus naphthalenovorans]